MQKLLREKVLPWKKWPVDNVYAAGQSLLWRHEFQAASERLKHAASKGHALAQFIVSAWSGNKTTSAELVLGCFLAKVASDGNPKGMCVLARCFEEGFGAGKDLNQTFKWFSQAADQNDPDGLFGLARCYDQGLGIPADLDRAASLYQAAAGLGHNSALYNVASMIQHGEGLPKDEAKAYQLFQKASSGGNADALYGVAHCYLTGRGTPKNEKEGMSLCLDAAKKGSILAQIQLGDYFRQNGHFEAALHWYQAAAERGNGAACWRVACCYQNGSGVQADHKKALHYCVLAAEGGCPDAQIILAEDAFANGDKAAAAGWFEKAGDQGNIDALIRLGCLFLEGHGVEQNRERAFQIFEQVAPEATDGLYWLGLCHFHGWGTPQDLPKAVEMFQLASEHGVVEAMITLAGCLKNGMGVHQDFTRSAQLYEQAANAGSASAMFFIGRCYQDGRGVPQDVKKAEEWFRASAAKGDNDAVFVLATLTQSKDEALAKFLALADEGAADAQYQAAMILLERKQYDRAFLLMKQSAAQGLVAAQFELGNFYFKGFGVAVNFQEAVRWYTVAAERGDNGAQNNLGARYRNGEGVPRDPAKAVYWFELAAAAGNSEAQFNLGACYCLGDGVEKNEARGCQLYQLAADQGHLDALFYLGVCYFNGKGVPKNIQRALELFTQASEKGHSQATMFKLALLSQTKLK